VTKIGTTEAEYADTSMLLAHRQHCTQKSPRLYLKIQTVRFLTIMQMYVCSDFAHFEQLLDNIADKRFRLLQSTLPLRGIIEKKLQFITKLTAIVHCFTHRKQQKR